MPFLVHVRKQVVGNSKEGGETGCKRTPVSEVLLLASQRKIAPSCLDWENFALGMLRENEVDVL